MNAFLKPFKDAGFETWIAPSVNNYPQGLSEQQQRAGEHSGLRARWAADGFNRDVEHDLERRRRGSFQPGLVRDSLWCGGFVAAGRVFDREF